MLLNRVGRCGRRSSTSRSGFPSGSRGFARSACARLYARRSPRRPRSLAYSEHEAEELRDWMARARRVDAASSSSRSASTSRRSRRRLATAGSRRRHGRRRPTSRRRAFVGLAAEMPNRTFRLVTTADRARSLGALPPNLEVEADISFDAMQPPARARRVSSHSPSSTTATRERPRCSCRRWRSGSPSSSRGRRRSRPDTGSSTARTAGSSRPATRSCSGAR